VALKIQSPFLLLWLLFSDSNEAGLNGMWVSINRISQIFIMLVEQTLRVKDFHRYNQGTHDQVYRVFQILFSEFIEKAITGEFIFFHRRGFDWWKRMSPAIKILK